MAILQPVIPHDAMSDSAILDVEDLDLSSIYSHSTPSHRKPNALPNGHHPTHQGRIFRQGDLTSLHTRHTSGSASERQFKILMLEPVQQGVLTPSTRIIISTAPYTTNTQLEVDLDGGMSEGGSTHTSLAEFDADAFLSSSLALSLPNGSPTLENGDLAQSISSETSGSITPRAPGVTRTTSSSPPAVIGDALGDEGQPGGTRFTAMKAMGPSSSADEGNDVCWVGVAGLGRAGIFEGDWVSLEQENEVF